MKIYNLRINHIMNPLGYWYKTLTASYLTENEEGQYQESARIQVSKDLEFTNIVFDTGRSQEVSGIGTRLDVKLRPCTRYYWKVQVWDERGNTEESDVAWFETGLMDVPFQGISISPCFEESVQPVYRKSFHLEKRPEHSRLYIACLGVYEVILNGERVGDEMLAPGFTVYEKYVQYQTYDISRYLKAGENSIEVSAGNGWYKGMYGYRQNDTYRFGKQFELVADLYADGTCILSSDTTWTAKKSQILETDMYDGEVYDTTFDNTQEYPVKKGLLDKAVLKERLGVPVKVMEIVKPKAILHTPAGETVIDMGQNMTGYVSFICREPRGTKVLLEHGEVLQNQCFYNQNYRTAKARYVYISDGTQRRVHAKLCFFGFQYIRVSGIKDVRLEDFEGHVLYSDLSMTGSLETGHKLLNQLMKNILWSQKGNFLDIPTDCPQRDEKMGWTGDAQIFAETACLNMECYPFFRKYLHDIALEQEETKGLVPQIVPSVGRNERTSAAWGDAAVIIPWKLYEIYGDTSILEEQYESMKEWISYIDSENRRNGTNPNLWENGFHYGDWLALDGGCYHMPTGGTDVFYVSSAYFYYSTSLLAKAAEVLGKSEDARYYQDKAEGIRQEILKEYFTGNGRLAIDTQTAYIVALVFEIVKEKAQKELIKGQFIRRMKKDGGSLKTGFVGTPFLLEALALCDRNDMAYQILLDEGFPSWLYPVKMGATTMWERWDALNPDGSMSSSGMNSLNHYANGSVEAWIYHHIAGLRPAKDGAGYKRVKIAPIPAAKIGHIKYQFESASGTYLIQWKIEKQDDRDKFQLDIKIPFGAEAEITLPFVGGEVKENGSVIQYEGTILRKAGNYCYSYVLQKTFKAHYSLEDSVKEMIKNPALKEYLYQKVPMLEKVDGAEIQKMTLKEMSKLPFFLGIGTRLGLGDKVLKEIEEYISGIEK